MNVIAAAGILIWVTGCATSKVVVQDRLGPCHKVAAAEASDGSLEVFSARTLAFNDPNAEIYFWNNDYGRNDFLYGVAHTDYTIHGADGALVRRVRNAEGINDDTPARVTLPAGSYTVEAQAEEYAGVNMTVVIPVAIEAGQSTTVHLEPNWKPAGEAMNAARLVRLADGRVLGCREQAMLSQNTR